MNKNPGQMWTAVDATVDPSAAEAIEHAFNELGSLGTEINNLRKDQKADVCVIGYFEHLPNECARRAAIDDALQIYGLDPETVRSTAIRMVENTDWLAEWKKHWKPVTVGPFVIAPPWETVDGPEIVIRIEPNMAFGTGTHETTQLCLQAIAANYQPGESFLDIGTGTGILAIAAAKLSSDARITACDTDADSIRIARENANANDVADRITFFHGSIDETGGVFDVVCANLTIDVILPILHELIQRSRRVLVLSGILADQEGMIVGRLAELRISDYSIDRAGEWIAVKVSVS